jgi:predicted RNase H-like HicB family nuclease
VPVTESLNLTIRYEANDDGRITAQVAELPGAISEGRTREQARTNVLDALQVLLTPDEELQGLRSDGNSESVTLKLDP